MILILLSLNTSWRKLSISTQKSVLFSTVSGVPSYRYTIIYSVTPESMGECFQNFTVRNHFSEYSCISVFGHYDVYL